MTKIDRNWCAYRSPMRFGVAAGRMLTDPCPLAFPPRRLLLLFSSIALVLGACGGGEDSTDVTTTLGQPTTTESPTTTASTVTSSKAAPTTTTTAETTVPVDEADAAIAVVVWALDAKNSFDLDGWLAAFEGGERPGTPLHAEELLMNAEQRWEMTAPCQVTGKSTSDDTIVECLLQDITSFWGVGGISDTRLQTFKVNSEGLITNKFSFSSNRRDAFNSAFHQWLSETYPDVYNEMNVALPSNGPGFDSKNSDHMLTAVEYVEEFVAQSDKYPLDPTDQ
jgi:hypothetical protein